MPNVIPCSLWSLTTFETPLGERLIANRDTDTQCRHLVVTDQFWHHAIENFHRDCVPNPHIGTGRRVERRVHTYQSPGGIKQGPPGIAGINRRVGLDYIGSLESTEIRNAPFESADDSGRQRLIEAKRIADCESSLPDFKRLRTAYGNRRRQRPIVVNADHSKI